MDAVDRTSAGLQFDWTSLLAPGGRYITLDTPVLKETDDKGLFCGLITSGIQLGNKLSKVYSDRYYYTSKAAVLKLENSALSIYCVLIIMCKLNPIKL